MSDRNHLQGRVALVTGSSRGIGTAIAATLARAGAAVAVHGRDRHALAAVAEGLRRENARVVEVCGDITRADDLETMRAVIEDALGPVDILVANAGGDLRPPGPLETVGGEEWRAVVDGNLTATFLSLKTFLSGLKKSGNGAVVTMASAAARRPTPQTPIAYAAAKAGIIALTRVAAAQLGPFGIRVNCVAPEIILTERNQSLIPQEIRIGLAKAHPLGRLGTPEDVAEAVLFLVGNQANWISGTVVDVAGGAVFA